MQNQNQAFSDLANYLDSIPFGTVVIPEIRIERRKIKSIQTVAEETLRYVDNQEAIKDIMGMLDNLIKTKFNGEAHIKLGMKDGQIQIIGIFNKKVQKYT